MKKDFESSFNGGFDDGNSPEIHCSEEEWAQYIAWADSETARFKIFYETLDVRDGEDRLDKCALAMGWQLDDEDVVIEDEIVRMFGNDFKISPPPGPIPVYSLLNTTEVIAVRAMVDSAKGNLTKIFETEAAGMHPFPQLDVFALASGFARAEQAMLLAIDALSAREYGLSILQMKRALSEWNDYLGKVGAFEEYWQKAEIAPKSILYRIRLVMRTIFDLRELCLRIIRDAKEDRSEDEKNNSGK